MTTMSQLELVMPGDRVVMSRPRRAHAGAVSATPITRVRQMSRYQRVFLRHFKRSDCVEAKREYPHEFVARFTLPNGETEPASLVVIANLLRRGLLEASPEDDVWDRIKYRLTPAGRAVVDRMRSCV
jgi:hypothetical protein